MVWGLWLICHGTTLWGKRRGGEALEGMGFGKGMEEWGGEVGRSWPGQGPWVREVIRQVWEEEWRGWGLRW